LPVGAILDGRVPGGAQLESGHRERHLILAEQLQRKLAGVAVALRTQILPRRLPYWNGLERGGHDGFLALAVNDQPQ
jgi:hypothetical protein